MKMKIRVFERLTGKDVTAQVANIGIKNGEYRVFDVFGTDFTDFVIFGIE